LGTPRDALSYFRSLIFSPSAFIKMFDSFLF
jgi:hypothetical protein